MVLALWNNIWKIKVLSKSKFLTYCIRKAENICLPSFTFLSNLKSHSEVLFGVAILLFNAVHTQNCFLFSLYLPAITNEG